jgi:CubicO group peptidase (beta-lactamase class C family)
MYLWSSEATRRSVEVIFADQGAEATTGVISNPHLSGSQAAKAHGGDEMNRQIVATLSILMTVTAVASPGHAEDLRGDEQAVALAERMLDTLGGRAAWARARTIRTELQGYFAREQEPWDETFWMDLEETWGRFEIKNDTIDRVIAWTPESGWESSDGTFEPLPDDRHRFELQYWQRQPVVVFHRLARGVPATRVEKGTNDLRFDAFDAESGELIAQFAVNMKGEPIKWGASIGDQEFEHVFGPLKEFGGVRLPEWGATISGVWRYQHVDVSISPSPPAVSFDPPSRSANHGSTDGSHFDRIERSVLGFFESESYPSLSVGIVRGDTLVYKRALGIADKRTGRAATTETIYEIGSVGKVLTTSVLAVLDDRGVLRIDDPVARWLPKGVEIPRHPSGGPPMTLEHLATHTSGLPGRPVNVSHLPEWQWPDYSAEQLFQGLAQTKLLYPPGTDLTYSSLGTGLLGYVMARASAATYERLVEEELLRPLGMGETVVHLSEDQRTRYAVGYETAESIDEAPHWEYGVLAGCGSHWSTVRDLARFVSALLSDRSTTPGGLSATARAELVRPRWRSQDGETEVALGWFVTRQPDVGVMLGHRGRTAGHGAFVGIIPDHAAGVIVLANLGGREANIRLAELGQRLLREVVLPQEE